MLKIFRRINFRSLKETLAIFAPVIVVPTILFSIVIGEIFDDPFSDPGRAGVIRCYPLGYAQNPNQATQNTARESSTDTEAYYQGPFIFLERQDADKVVFFDINRRKIQISNATCIATFNEPEE